MTAREQLMFENRMISMLINTSYGVIVKREVRELECYYRKIRYNNAILKHTKTATIGV